MEKTDRGHFAGKSFSDDEIRAIRSARAKGAKLKDLGRARGLSEGAVSRICARKAYAHVEDDPNATWDEGAVLHVTGGVA